MFPSSLGHIDLIEANCSFGLIPSLSLLIEERKTEWPQLFRTQIHTPVKDAI